MSLNTQVPKKRGRKAKTTQQISNEDIPSFYSTIKPEPLILEFRVKANDILPLIEEEQKNLKLDDTKIKQIEIIKSLDFDYQSILETEKDLTLSNERLNYSFLKKSDPEPKREEQKQEHEPETQNEILTKIHNINSLQSYPNQTFCMWDSHPFFNQPFSIPIKYNIFTNVFSNIYHFCSPNCALAYLIQMKQSYSDFWTRFSYLKTLYGSHIQVAPDRLLLNIFGGNLNIEEFRACFVKIITNDYPVDTIMSSYDIDNLTNSTNEMIPKFRLSRLKK